MSRKEQTAPCLSPTSDAPPIPWEIRILSQRLSENIVVPQRTIPLRFNYWDIEIGQGRRYVSIGYHASRETSTERRVGELVAFDHGYALLLDSACDVAIVERVMLCLRQALQSHGYDIRQVVRPTKTPTDKRSLS